MEDINIENTQNTVSLRLEIRCAALIVIYLTILRMGIAVDDCEGPATIESVGVCF